MPKTMSDTDREEAAEQRAIDLRAKRIKVVWKALSKKKRKTTKQISNEVGLSPELVRSTVNLIRRQTDDNHATPISYDPATHEYWIAVDWTDDQDIYIEWLRKHLTTRAYSLAELIDVAVATWPGDVPLDLLVGIKQVDAAIRSLEAAVKVEREKAQQKADRGVKLHG